MLEGGREGECRKGERASWATDFTGKDCPFVDNNAVSHRRKVLFKDSNVVYH